MSAKVAVVAETSDGHADGGDLRSRIVSRSTVSYENARHAHRGLRRSRGGRQDLHSQHRDEPVHRVRPVRADRQVVVDPVRAVREVARDVFYAVLIHVSAVGRLSGKRRRVR
jgi:hypothetical protein